jgi:hypothetical protein
MTTVPTTPPRTEHFDLIERLWSMSTVPASGSKGRLTALSSMAAANELLLVEAASNKTVNVS